MMKANSERIIELFSEAMAMPSPDERARFLARACKDEPEVREQVESLLRAGEPAPDFLKQPPPGTGATVDLVTEKPGDVFGPYKLLQQIGEGGFGVVWMAEQSQPILRKVALKVVKAGMDTKQVLARFEAERQALAMMDHPNIARVLDAGATPAGRPYFAMELVKGIPITEFCDQKQLDTRQRLELFCDVCSAVNHAHQKGVIHRDLKPSNVMVTLNGDHAVAKVIDFGIAKATEQKLTDKTLFTRFEQFLGTPVYMSPEQAAMSTADIDTRSDIYSLGMLLYELLAGRPAFDPKTLLAAGYDEMRRIIKEDEPPRPSVTRRLTQTRSQPAPEASENPALHTSHSALDPDLDWIVMKCLEKDRTRRYETANALSADIQRHLTNEPVTARPASKVYRFQKAFRRNKLAFTAAAAIAVILILGVLVSTWQALEASTARNAEKEQRLAETRERLRADAETAEARRHLYGAHMSLAQQTWDQSNIRRLRELLNDTRNSPYRGFEWFYWQRQCHLDLKTFRGHLKRVTSASFSPDGQRIVTGSEDRTAKIWEVASGRELLTLTGHASSVLSVAFSPDGQRIVTGSADRTAKVWEAASGGELFTLKGHKAPISSVAFSPDGQRIVTGSADHTAKVWELVGGRELFTLKGHSAPVLSVAFSPDGRRIFTGGRDHAAKVWEAADGQELLTLKEGGESAGPMAISRDGARVLTGGRGDGMARVWEAAGGRERLAVKASWFGVVSVAISPDGQRIATSGYDAKVWEVASGKELLTLKGHMDHIWAVGFSPDGRRIVTGGDDGTAKVWDATSGGERRTFKGHSAPIVSMAFSPDGRRVLTGSADQTAKIWEASGGPELLTFNGHRAPIVSVAFSPDGERVVTGSEDQTARVWEAATGRELFTLKGHSAPIRSVAFFPDGQQIVTGSGDHTAKVWEAASGRERLTLLGHSAPILSVTFSPDGQRIVTGSGDHSAKVWEAASGRELLTLKGHTSWVLCVAFSPDGQRIVTSSADSTAKVWETATGRELLALEGHNTWIGCVTFSPDGQRIVTGTYGIRVRVWDAASGRELLTLDGLDGANLALAFSPDGQRIFTGSADQTSNVCQAARAEQVAAWQVEDAAAADYLAARHRERTAQQEIQRVARAGDEGAIKRWLILGPIAPATDQSETDTLEVEQIEGEGRLRPSAGEAIATSSGELRWQEVVQESGVIDFNRIFGSKSVRSVGYAVCYIQSAAGQRGLRALVGSDDASKVYLNGKQIHESPFLRSFVTDEDMAQDITLNAGLNVLVFKVLQENMGTWEDSDWKGSIRFTDAAGHPVKGIKVTLDPDAKD